MITAKHICDISETYLKIVTSMGHKAPVFVNPTSSDFLSILKSAAEYDGTARETECIRFVADANNGTVYCMEGYLITHDGLRQDVGLPTDFVLTPWLFDGIGRIVNGKAKVDAWGSWDKFEWIIKLINNKKVSDVRLFKWLDNTFKYNWSFVDNYISGFSNMVNACKQRYIEATNNK